MPKWKLVIEYQGTRYQGWQEQPRARTVQGELRAAAENLLGTKVDLAGAGRTDAGVHAIAQVAHLSINRTLKLAPHQLQQGLNDRLPADIGIRSVSLANNRFHARHDAVERLYIYQIATRRTAFAKPFVWWVKDLLDTEQMETALGLLIGRQDFRAFAEKSPEDRSTIVEVTQCELARYPDLIVIRIGASHFLWKMVRRIMGVLVEVGRGNLAPDEISQLLAGSKQSIAQWTAPPSGLFLEAVRYPGDAPVGPLEPAMFFR